MKVSPTEVRISTGVILELHRDEATNLVYALRDYRKFREDKNDRPSSRGKWPWLDELIESIDAARGTGCTMGGKL